VSNFFNIIRDPLSISCHVSRVTCHASRSLCHVSRVTRHALIFLLIAAHAYSQDVKPPVTLQFQQQAPQAGNEEQMALQFYQNHEFDKAAELFGRIYEKKPSIFNYQYLYFCLVEIKEYNQAERLVKKCMKAEQDAPKYLVDLGYISFREGHPDKSRKYYEEALKKLVANQQQVFDLANAFTTRGEFEYAIRTYQKGRQLLNNSYPFGFEMAGVYERMGEFDNAMEAYLDLLESNNTFMNTVQDRIQMILAYDVSNDKNERLRKILLGRAQREPDKTCFAELLWWYSIQQKDFDIALIQAKALDRRLKENGEKLSSLANLAVSNERFDIAIECYQYLVSKGPSGFFFEVSRRELANTRYLQIIAEPVPSKKQLELLEKEIHEMLKESEDDPSNIKLIRNLAHIKAFYLEKPKEATDLLTHVIQLPGISAAEQAKCKIELADILLFTDDVWEATLLYQQAYQDFKFDVMGQEAKFKNARLSFYIGEFKWAKAQADILKASTSKFISNDAIALSLLISENYDPDSNTIALGMYARADLLDYRNEEDRALVTLDSIPLTFREHPILQQVLYKKGEIKRKQGKYAGADSLFQLVAKEYPNEIMADDALMQAAALNEKQLNNRAKAMSLYQELLDQYPGSIFVADARKKFRTLRGDNIQ